MAKSRLIGEKVIVRADRAGVLYGTLIERDDDMVYLEDTRKLFYWKGAGAVEGIAAAGVKSPADCKFTMKVGAQEVFGVIQVLKANDEAIKIIESVPEWNG